MLISAVFEIINIGAVLSFLTVLSAPEKLYEIPFLQPFLHYFSINNARELLLPITIGFGLVTLLTNGLRLAVLWLNTRLSSAAGCDLSIDAYRRTLYQPYAIHVSRNSSEVINGVLGKVSSAVSTITTAFNLIGSTIMLIAILIAIFSIDPWVAALAFGGFGLIYAVVIKVTRNKLLANGYRASRESTQVLKVLQEGLGGIRDILLDGTQSVYCDEYRKADQISRRAQGNITIIGATPRYGVESFGIILILVLAYVVANSANGVDAVIPVLGALALAAQRLLPALQSIYSSWTAIQGNRSSIRDALELLDQPMPEYANTESVEKIPFTRHIKIEDVNFRYIKDGSWVLKDINIEILKGEKIGFIGKTGSGKSTLLDIFMALLEPTNGAIVVDGIKVNVLNQRSWQRRIAHVPQSIFLADTSIGENIAFGLPLGEVDWVKVENAARQAQIGDFIEGLPEAYQTLVGERGVRLSGGQRQRIGIARALYKSADIIVLDEATSALDSETEAAIMGCIEQLSGELTILIIAHRVTTLKGCDRIYKLQDGSIQGFGDYDSMISST